MLELTGLMCWLISTWSTSHLKTLWRLSLPLMPSSSTSAGWRGGRLGVAFGGGSCRSDWAGLCRGLRVALGGGRCGSWRLGVTLGGGCCFSWRLRVALGGGRGCSWRLGVTLGRWACGGLRVALRGGRCCTRWRRSWLRVTLGGWTCGWLWVTLGGRCSRAWGWCRRLRVAFRRWPGGRLGITFGGGGRGSWRAAGLRVALGGRWCCGLRITLAGWSGRFGKWAGSGSCGGAVWTRWLSGSWCGRSCTWRRLWCGCGCGWRRARWRSITLGWTLAWRAEGSDEIT